MRYAVLISSQLAVASAALLARWGMGLGIGPGPLTAWRLTIASAVLLLVALSWRRSPEPRPAVPLKAACVLVAAGAALGLHFWAWFASLEHISVARSTLLVSTTPVWAGLGAWALTGVAPKRGFWAALIVAGVGAWLVTSTDATRAGLGPEASTVFGDAAATLGAVSIAAYFLLTAPYQERLGTLRVVAWTYPWAAVAAWLGVAFWGGEQGVWVSGVEPCVVVLAMALVPQLVGHTALNWSLKHFSAGAVGAATLLEPVFAGALAWLFLHETPAAVQMLGACILLTGVGWALMAGRPTAGPVGGGTPALRLGREGEDE